MTTYYIKSSAKDAVSAVLTIVTPETADGAVYAIAKTTDDVTTLSLEITDMEKITGTELAEVFSLIPANVTSLDLRYCELHKMKGSELAIAFAIIPKHITTIAIILTDIYFLTIPELIALGESLPHLADISVSSSIDVYMAGGPDQVPSVMILKQFAGAYVREAYQSLINFLPSVLALVVLETLLGVAAKKINDLIHAPKLIECTKDASQNSNAELLGAQGLFKAPATMDEDSFRPKRRRTTAPSPSTQAEWDDGDHEKSGACVIQ